RHAAKATPAHSRGRRRRHHHRGGRGHGAPAKPAGRRGQRQQVARGDHRVTPTGRSVENLVPNTTGRSGAASFLRIHLSLTVRPKPVAMQPDPTRKGIVITTISTVLCGVYLWLRYFVLA